MATYSAIRAKHATLTGLTVDSVQLSPTADIEVFNHTGSADLWVAVGLSSPADPSIGGDDCDFVPAGCVRSIHLPGGNSLGASVFVKVIGNGNFYSVVGVF